MLHSLEWNRDTKGSVGTIAESRRHQILQLVTNIFTGDSQKAAVQYPSHPPFELIHIFSISQGYFMCTLRGAVKTSQRAIISESSSRPCGLARGSPRGGYAHSTCIRCSSRDGPSSSFPSASSASSPVRPTRTSLR